MGNCIRLLLAKLVVEFTAGVFRSNYFLKYLADFSKFEIFQLRISKNGFKIKF